MAFAYGQLRDSTKNSHVYIYICVYFYLYTYIYVYHHTTKRCIFAQYAPKVEGYRGRGGLRVFAVISTLYNLFCFEADSSACWNQKPTYKDIGAITVECPLDTCLAIQPHRNQASSSSLGPCLWEFCPVRKGEEGRGGGGEERGGQSSPNQPTTQQPDKQLDEIGLHASYKKMRTTNRNCKTRSDWRYHRQPRHESILWTKYVMTSRSNETGQIVRYRQRWAIPFEATRRVWLMEPSTPS